MSQNPRKPKEKIVASPHKAIVVNQPAVRSFSTGGGHGPEDTLVEGDGRIVTKKWQGYPPQNLSVVGKPFPPMPEVAIPRYTGKAEYATRVNFPNMVWIKVLPSPHPRARVRRLDVSKAAKMPGVAYILTAENAPQTYPFPQELFFQGELVAMVAADTEDLAEDAVAAIEVEYEALPFAATIDQIMAAGAPDLRGGRGNAIRAESSFGNVDKGFAEADVVKEFTYRYSGAIPVPMQPGGGVAKWEGDRLTFWGFGQGIYPQRAGLARGLGIDESSVRFIDKYNGCTLGGGMALARLNPWIAYIAKMTGRPAKLMLQKDHELAFLQIKPQNIVTFKVGARKDGRITACHRTFYVNIGMNDSAAGGQGQGGGRAELYLHVVPNWKETGFMYRTNTMLTGPSRSNMQQEFKWGWEQMMDEMAEAVGMDPVEFRLLNVQKPGTTLTHEQGGVTVIPMPESKNGTLTYDSYAVLEVLQEGKKVIGWEDRNAKPGGAPGRFKRGIGVALNQHHAGRVGYHDGEVGFEWVIKRGGQPAGGGGRLAGPPAQGGGGGIAGGGGLRDAYTGHVDLNAEGHIVLHFAQPDSGTNHATSMAAQVAEILGFTDLRQMRVIWGDSDLTPPAPGWNSGLTTQLQGGALCRAADKMRQELLRQAAARLRVDAATLTIRDGVISSNDNPSARVTFAALAKANKGLLRSEARCVHPGSIGRAMNRGVGCCFAEVEVDTYTGNFRWLRAAYCHDSGNVVNPLLAEGDMNGSLVQSMGVTTDAVPWDREFPGTSHYSVGYLSYRLPTIMEVPDQTNVFVNSLEPRWFFGCKGFAETAIGAPPGALANAIYNACGVRIREHPITREKIMAGLKALRAKEETTA